jgi:hypothetical protein
MWSRPMTSVAMFDPFSDPIIAEQSGKVQFEDIHQGNHPEGSEVNEDTG